MKDLDDAFDNVASVREEDDDDDLNPDVIPVQGEQAAVQAAKQPKRQKSLMLQVTHLRHRLDVVKRNFALLLIYMTVFLDFIGITLLSPGMRFMIDPANAGAFDDIRVPSHCLELANQTAPAEGCEPRTNLQPGTAISIMMFTYGIGQLFSGALMGWASDRYGPRRVLIVSTAGTPVTFALQGCVWSFWPHAAVRFLGGLFGGSRPVCAAYIAATVAPHERAKMLVRARTCTPRAACAGSPSHLPSAPHARMQPLHSLSPPRKSCLTETCLTGTFR